MLIGDTVNPKCFTRTRMDFTCFFETKDNGTYDFLYSSEGGPSKKCKMSIHGTENGTFLHVCSFPRTAIFLYCETEVEVVDRTKNSRLYNRTVFVEDLCLLDPPFNISVKPNDNVGELIASLETVNYKLIEEKEKEYRIRFSSVRQGEQRDQGRNKSFLLRMKPGEEVEIQASVRCVSESGPNDGYWSAWSKPVRAIVPPAADMWFRWSICVPMFILAISFIATFFLYCRKLKEYFWPPVPNLEKVLQGFLIDINQQKWGPLVVAKLCFEETTPSVVEIMSDDEIPGLVKPSEEFSDLLSSDGSFSTEEQADGSSGSEALRDYVTLNKDLHVLCLKENCYVYEQFKDTEEPDKGHEPLKTCHCLKPCSCNNYFNRSYLLLAQSTDSLNHKIHNEKCVRNPYTNIPLN